MAVKVEINPKGVAELFKSDEMQSYLAEVGESIAERAGSMSGEEYASRVHNASFTAICNVYPDSKEAASDNYKNNTLLKAARGAGLPETKPHL